MIESTSVFSLDYSLHSVHISFWWFSVYFHLYNAYTLAWWVFECFNSAHPGLCFTTFFDIFRTLNQLFVLNSIMIARSSSSIISNTIFMLKLTQRRRRKRHQICICGYIIHVSSNLCAALCWYAVCYFISILI